MARIFFVLALLAVLLLTANFVVGLAGGDFNAAAGGKRAAQARLVNLERASRAERRRSSPELDEARAAARSADAAFQPLRARMTLHMLLGSAAALVTVLVNSIAITYFIGTSRWCREVCEAYGIRGELAQRSAKLKRSTFPWALAGIAAILVVVASGAAADPSGANFVRSRSFVLPHYAAAMIGLVVVIAAFWAQIQRIAENHTVIDEILVEVRRIRGGQKLPTESLAVP